MNNDCESHQSQGPVLGFRFDSANKLQTRAMKAARAGESLAQCPSHACCMHTARSNFMLGHCVLSAPQILSAYAQYFGFSCAHMKLKFAFCAVFSSGDAPNDAILSNERISLWLWCRHGDRHAYSIRTTGGISIRALFHRERLAAPLLP